MTMPGKRRVYGAPFKAKVAMAAAKGDRTTAQLASQFGIHTSQVTAWKKQLMAQVAELFADGERPPQPALTALIASRVDKFQPVFKEATHGSTGRSAEVRGMAATAAAVHGIRHDGVPVLRSGGRVSRRLPLLASEAQSASA